MSLQDSCRNDLCLLTVFQHSCLSLTRKAIPVNMPWCARTGPLSALFWHIIACLQGGCLSTATVRGTCGSQVSPHFGDVNTSLTLNLLKYGRLSGLPAWEGRLIRAWSAYFINPRLAVLIIGYIKFYYNAKITKLIHIPLSGHQGSSTCSSGMANTMAEDDIVLQEIKSYNHNHVCSIHSLQSVDADLGKIWLSHFTSDLITWRSGGTIPHNSIAKLRKKRLEQVIMPICQSTLDYNTVSIHCKNCTDSVNRK